MHTIRLATEADNTALCALEHRCAQGGSITVYHVRDDYCRRSRQYGDAPRCAHWVCVGDHDDIAGAIAAIVRDQAVNGEVVPVLYLFDVRVDPAYRRRGIARALVEHAHVHGRDALGCRFATGWIEGENEPSLRLFDGLGYHRARMQVVPVVAVAPRVPRIGRRFDVRWTDARDPEASHVARSVSAASAASAASADDAASLTASLTASMTAYLARRQFVLQDGSALDSHGAYRGRVVVTDRERRVGVSARLWDPSAIRRIAFERMPIMATLARPAFAVGALLGLSPRMPRPHEPFTEWFIYDCRLHAQKAIPNPAIVQRLTRALLSSVRQRMLEAARGTGRLPIGLHAPIDVESPLWPSLKRVAMYVAHVQWAVRSLAGDAEPAPDPTAWERPVDFDPRDF